MIRVYINPFSSTAFLCGVGGNICKGFNIVLKSQVFPTTFEGSYSKAFSTKDLALYLTSTK